MAADPNHGGLFLGEAVKFVKIFAKVPYPQHYYNTGCLDEESLGMDRVAEHGS